MPRIFRALLLLLLFPLTAQATARITSEIPVAKPVPAPQEGWQRPDSVATDGHDFLVAWPGPGGVNAMPVSADGNVSGTARIAVARPDQVSGISLCWTGAAYLATWRDAAAKAVMAVTLSRDGVATAAPRVIVADVGTVMVNTAAGALAANGSRALFAYTQTNLAGPGLANTEARAALLDVDGALLSDLPLPVGNIASNLVDTVPRVVADGEGYAIAWRTGDLRPIDNSGNPPLQQLMHTFHLLRLNGDGSAVGGTIDLPRNEQTGVEYGLAFGGGKYAIAALEIHLIKPGSTQPRIVRYTIDRASGAVETLPSVDTGGYEAGVAWNGSRFIAYWSDYTSTSFRMLTLPFDASQPSTILQGATLAFMPRLAWNGKDLMMVWSGNITEVNGSTQSIFAARLNPSATALAGAAPSLVSLGWSRQWSPSIATGNGQSLIVWVDERGDYLRGRLLGLRVTLGGAPIDAAPFEIAPSAAQYATPAVTFTGNAFLVAWEGAPDATIAVRRVGLDGSLGTPVSLGNGYVPAAASNSSVTLVAFGVQGKGAVGYRFDAQGALLDPTPLPIGGNRAPFVASNGTDFFVAWAVGSDYWQFPPPDYLDIVGKRVTASGAVDASPLPIATGPSDQVLRGIASDGRDYLVLYELIPGGGSKSPHSMAAKRVLREGVLDGGTSTDDGTIIATVESFAQVGPATVAGDANGFSVAWVEFNAPNATLKLAQTDSRGNPATPVTVDTYSVDGRPLAISLAQPRGAPLQMVYWRRLNDPAYGPTSRAFLRLVGDPPAGRQRASRH